MDKIFFKTLNSQLIFNGVKNCSVAEIRANWLRMLGTLGCLLPENLVRIIITFIVEACSDVIKEIFPCIYWKLIIIYITI